jgi:hypothetical protein
MIFASGPNPAKAAKHISTQNAFPARPPRLLREPQREARVRHGTLICAAAVSCLAGVFANASAKADVFQFTFGRLATGTFTTGAAASDPGYELITGLTFNVLTIEYTDGGNRGQLYDLKATRFLPGAAFNPTTGAFIANATSSRPEIGDFFVFGVGGGKQLSALIYGVSFRENSVGLMGTVVGIGGYIIDDQTPLVIARTTSPAVPEASTWAMMLLGFSGLGFAAWSKGRAVRSSA